MLANLRFDGVGGGDELQADGCLVKRAFYLPEFEARHSVGHSIHYEVADGIGPVMLFWVVHDDPHDLAPIVFGHVHDGHQFVGGPGDDVSSPDLLTVHITNSNGPLPFLALV